MTSLITTIILLAGIAILIAVNERVRRWSRENKGRLDIGPALQRDHEIYLRGIEDEIRKEYGPDQNN